MRRLLCISAALAIAFYLAGSACLAEEGEGPKLKAGGDKKAQPDKEAAKKEAAKKEAAKREAAHKKDAPGEMSSFTDDMQKLNELVSLSDEQNKKLQEMRSSRDKALEEWDKANEGKLDKARDALGKLKDKKGAQNDNMRKSIEQGVGGLNMQRLKLMASWEKRMFALLTPEQKGKWNGPVTYEAVMREFQFLTFLMNKAQEEKVQGLCTTSSARLDVPVSSATHPQLIEGLVKKVYQGVLSAEQRKDFSQSKTTANKRPDGRNGRG